MPIVKCGVCGAENSFHSGQHDTAGQCVKCDAGIRIFDQQRMSGKKQTGKRQSKQSQTILYARLLSLSCFTAVIIWGVWFAEPSKKGKLLNAARGSSLVQNTRFTGANVVISEVTPLWQATPNSEKLKFLENLIAITEIDDLSISVFDGDELVGSAWAGDIFVVDG